MTFIKTTASSFPPYYYSQDELIAAVRKYWQAGHRNVDRLERIQRNSQVEGRFLALPIDAYDQLDGFGQSNQAWIDVALKLGEETVCTLLNNAGLAAEDVHMLITTTVTGVAVPSIDARLMNKIPFRKDLKRVPLFGLGCLGGAAGVARAADYLKGHPDHAVILLSIELCSLTLQKNDISIENVVSSGLFGDGAAGVLLIGSQHPMAEAGLCQVVDSRSVFFDQTEHIMGWEVRNTGLKVVLSADVSTVAETELLGPVSEFLGDHKLSIADIQHWVSHPGGPKVMQAIENGLGLKEQALQLSRESLAKVGNISSSSVLLILSETLSRYQPQAGTYGVMLAMGPAFCAELVLLKW